MNINSTDNITIEYDLETLTKIKKMIEEGFYKLKSFIKSINKTSNSNIYEELDKDFDTIILKLKESKLCIEHDYFLSIKDYILYIVRKNSIEPSFEHCNFAVELLEFFKELFKTNLNYYKNSVKIPNDEFKIQQKKFKEKYWKYRYTFYSEIYQTSNEFSEEEIYKIHESLREELDVIFHRY